MRSRAFYRQSGRHRTQVLRRAALSETEGPSRVNRRGELTFLTWRFQFESSTRQRKAISAPAPAFKPRKLKKASEDYRDRAEERRLGKEGDYAQVEAILEEFEKR